MIVQAATGMTLLGAAPVNLALIDLALSYAPFLVAADGGAKTALSKGHSPDAVIGDLDSFEKADRLNFPTDRLHRIAEQNSTDFEKCLRNVTAPFIIAIGVTGARLDHTLAAMTALTKFPDQAVVLLGDTDICFLCPAEFSITLPLKTRLSLFPMAKVSGTSVGLKYPINGLEFAPDRQIGTSNEVDGPNVTLRFKNRKMLVLLPRQHLGAVLAALVPAG